MSITVNLKRITNLPGRYDRKVELSFRGFTHKTKILQCENLAIFNEQFRWPHYGKGIRDEVLTVNVYNGSKVFSNRLLGKLVVSLQHVVTTGRMLLREPLTGANYSLTDIYVELDIRYQPIQGSAGGWEGEEFLEVEDRDESGLVIMNTGFTDARLSEMGTPRPELLTRAVRRLGRDLLQTGDEDNEDDEDDDDFDMDTMEPSNITFTPILSRCRALSRYGHIAIPRVQSFQVNVSILEAQKLQGVNINPAVFVRVEKEKRHTATQKSTNCPYYNENFVFEFHETQDVLFDKVIEMTVVHKRLLGLLMKRIGIFKIDISTVYSQPDHRFYQKWAPLTDPSDTRSGIRGYVKASISVLRKGDEISIPSAGAKSDDLDKNLLLPRRMPAERPWARFLVKVYQAEGLPSMSAGFLGNFSKMMDKNVFIDPYVQVTFAGQQGETSVVTGTNSPTWNEQISFIEQFPPLARRIKIQILDDANIGDVAVATHFLDLQQISDPTRNGFDPTFGPSWVNLYGSPRNSALRDVHQAMNEGLGEGIFYRGRLLLALSVEVYSSPSPTAMETTQSSIVKGALGRMKRMSKKSKEKKQEGASTVETEEAGAEVPEAVTVEVEEVHPIPEGLVGTKEEFLLFASFFEVTMMDPLVGRKPFSFELSIGNNGKVVEVMKSKKSGNKEGLSRSREELNRSREDVSVSMEDLSDDGQLLLGSDDELERRQPLDPGSLDRSVSKPLRPQPTEFDKSYRCVHLFEEKPCLYLWCSFEDHSFRYYSCNWLHKMADRLEIGLEDVEGLLKRPGSKVKERLVEVLTEFVASCKQYCSNAYKRGACKPNNLDKRRQDFLRRNIVLLAKAALRARRRVTRKTANAKLAETNKILKKLHLLAKEPQSTLPDVFVWMLSAGRRVAYCRIPSYSILYSLVEEQRGKDCGKLSTMYMKTPGGPVGEIFAKLEVYLWLGPIKYVKNCITSLPEEFQPENETMPAGVLMPANMPPISLTCQDSRYFQLRCHIYQARGIIASDDNGLSDPFARVVFSTQCQVTQILNQTLSPTWCELLLFDRILIEGTKEALRDDPPIIIINLFDHDAMSKPDPLGRAFAEPELKFVEEPYKKPRLKFFNITRGRSNAGELLGAFELIELDYSYGEPSLKSDVDPQEPQFLEEQRCYVIPEGVRPVLKTFRIEVLFWGLRDLRRVNLFEVERPQVRMECAGHRLESEEMESYKLTPNFKEVIKYFHVELPEQAYLHPPLTIFVLEQRAFGRLVLVGTHVVQSLMAFGSQDQEGWEDEEEEQPKKRVRLPSLKKTTSLGMLQTMQLGNLPIKMSKIPLKLIPFQKQTNKEELEEDVPEKEELDWWSKYYASLEELAKLQAEIEEDLEDQQEADAANLTMEGLEEEEEEIEEIDLPKPKRKKIATLQIYNTELENEFSQFMDWLHIFPLQTGKSVGEDEEEDKDDRIVGKYKGSFLLYPISPEDEDSECVLTNGLPRNTPIKVLIRVYIVKATNLAPMDPNGKADPYLVLRMGQQKNDTKDRYIPKQLHPVFGEVFEISASYPLETELTISVYDHNVLGSDDVIGETSIDLENRFYSRHYAGCGIALYYDRDGYNMWRDSKKPTVILSELCRKNSIPTPEYRESEVKVLNKIFKVPPEAFPEELLKKNNRTVEEDAEMEEHKALSVLHRWGEMKEFCGTACPLVPEHVEMRSLWNADKPGLPRGYVHMWIDQFPLDVPPPPPIDIKPRQPIQYELRVIIWNTDDVVLGVNPFTGTASSDIYVKGWIKGLENDKQETDVHFHSLTGEGKFNWRFVFRFNFLPTEKEISYKKKESIFSVDEVEFRQPAVLMLQVWDYDLIGSNDFLGSIELYLPDMVRGAKSASQCSITMAKDRAMPRFSIFRSKRMKGWWPLIKPKSQDDIEREKKEAAEANKKGKKKSKRGNMKLEDLEFTESGVTYLLMGKVEAEFQLVTVEEAENAPVGKARKEPEPLDKPDRPNMSFSWFVNPMKMFVYYIWKNYWKYIIALLILVVLVLFLVLIFYTLPGQISQLLVNG